MDSAGPGYWHWESPGNSPLFTHLCPTGHVETESHKMVSEQLALQALFVNVPWSRSTQQTI